MVSEFKYRPDVDGLRAVAVVFVLLFHADLGFPGGFVGVDVFFVISGYLITSLLLKEQQSSGIHLTNFWIRRIRRILPVSTFVVFVTLLASFPILLPSDYTDLAKSAIAQQLMTSNLYFWKNTGYFAGEAELAPLLHTWSLGVEEQFYIGYPFLILILGRYSRKTMATVLTALLVLSFGVGVWGVRTHAVAAFFILPTRAWELLLGGLLCFVPQLGKTNASTANVLSWLGIAGLFVSAWYFDSTSKFPGVSALLPCVATAILIYSNSSRLTWIGKVLSAKPIVYIGLISFSLYLWHWPILCLMRHLNSGVMPNAMYRVLALGASLVLAALSYTLIETPFRRKVVFPKTKELLSASVGAVSLVLACSFLLVYFEGLPQRITPQAIAFAAAKDSTLFEHDTSTAEVEAGDLPTFGDKEGVYTCLVWGDSHAMALISGIDAACKNSKVSGLQATRSSTAPVLDFYVTKKYGLNEGAIELNRAVVDFVLDRDIDVVIIAAMWSTYTDHPEFEPRLARTISELVDAGVQVAIVRDVARHDSDVPLTLSWAVRQGRNLDEFFVSREEYLELNEPSNAILDRLKDEGAMVLDPEPLLADSAGNWPAQIGGVSMYRDSHHLSNEGSLRLSTLIETTFESFGLK